MKIAILTQPLHSNYGGILQNYALQIILKQLGHDALTLDRHKKHQISIARDFFVRILQYLKIKSIPCVKTIKQEEYITEELIRFIYTHIDKTPNFYSKRKLCRYVRKYNFDAYVVGSDQVWRPMYSPDIYTYFLDFLGDSKCCRIAYAASFGVDNWEFSKQQTDKCRKLIKLFDFVSVREDSAITLCNKYLEVNAIQVVDPTLLLNKEDYLKLVPNINIKHKKLYTYILDESSLKRNIIRRVAKILDLDEYSVMPSQSFNYNTLNKLDECKFASIEKWLEGFASADFVVIDSFHGCVFSIIFNKPFIVIGNKIRGNARFDSLLKKFELEDLLVFDENFNTSLLKKKFNWAKINSIREQEKKIAIEYLEKYLRKK